MSSAGSKSSPSSRNVSGQKRISATSNRSLTLRKMRPVFTRDQEFTGSVDSRRASATRETAESERPQIFTGSVDSRRVSAARETAESERPQIFTGSVDSRRVSAARETAESDGSRKYLPRISRSRFKRYQDTKQTLKPIYTT